MFINKQFLYLWASQGLSQFATNILVFFLSFFVYKQTTSNIAVSGALLSFLIPSFLSSIVAGIVVGRMGKRWVLFFSNVFRAIIVAAMFFLEKNILSLYFLIGLLALTTQFFAPAESSLIPKIVPEKKLIAANAFFSITVYLTLIIGFFISPIFFKLFGYGALFIIFVMYVLSAIIVYFLNYKEPIFYTNFRQPVKTLISKFTQNSKYVFSRFYEDRSINKNVFNIIIIQVVIFVLISLAPGFADKILRIPVEDLSFSIVFPTALGFLVASLLITRFKRIKEQNLIKMCFWLLAGVFTLIFIISEFKSRQVLNDINFFLLMLFGLFSGIIAILSYTHLQQGKGEQSKAGFFGILNALVNLASILPVLLSGFLSDFFGVDKILLLIAGMFLVVAVKSKKE